jgi:hypothetical protein
MKTKHEYPIPKEGQLLKIKLDPNGLHDTIGNLDPDQDWLIDARIKELRRQNLAKGFKDGFKPTFSIEQWRKLKPTPTR